MIESLSDEELERRLEESLGEERKRVADFLAHLIEFDDRKLGQKRSYSSTFDYCWRKLRLSEDECYKRIQVARAARARRVILEYVREGKLSLTAILRVAPHLKKDPALLEWAMGKSTREMEARLAALSGSSGPNREIVAFVPARRRTKPDTEPPLLTASPPRSDEPAPVPAQTAPNPTTDHAAPPEASLDWEVRLHFTANRELFEKIERAKDLTRHKHPTGSIEEIVEEAIDALLDVIDRNRKLKPAPERPVLPDRRRIPEWVKDIVWKRDGGRCTYEVGGRRCDATAWLEFDHLLPFGFGGRSDDPANIRLLCRAHNQIDNEPPRE